MKRLVLLRGLPGSGKTDLAISLFGTMFPLANPKLGDGHKTVAHYSTDHYFERLGYFDPSKLKEAHEWNRSNVEDAMQEKTDWIFVHNTFTQSWEMEKFFEMAEEYDYRVHVVTVENWHEGENVHNVSFPKIEKMARRFEHRLYPDHLKPTLGCIFDQLYSVEQTERHHPEGNVGIHTELVVGKLVHEDPTDVLLHFAGLFHDIGKLHTSRYNEEKEKWTAYGHEFVSEEYVMSYYDILWGHFGDMSLGDAVKLRDNIAWIVRNHMRVKNIGQMRTHKQNELKEHDMYGRLVKLTHADNMRRLYDEEPENIEMYRELGHEFMSKVL